MKIIEDTQGNYIRTVEDIETDFTFLKECLSDWPVIPFSDEFLHDKVEHASTMDAIEVFTSPTPTFYNGIFIYCNMQDVPMVFIEASFYFNDVFIGEFCTVASHPSHRGAGKFSEFMQMMTWFTNKVIKVEKGIAQMVGGVPATALHNDRIKGISEGKYASKKNSGVELTQLKWDLHETLEVIDTYIGGRQFSSIIPIVPIEYRQKQGKRFKNKTYEFGWDTDSGETKVIRKPYVRRR